MKKTDVEPQGEYVLDEVLTDSTFEQVPRMVFDKPSRWAARGILLVDEDNIIMMYMGTKDSYKLPGGGIEGEESPEEAFIREVQEETGYTCTNIQYIGEIQEHKGRTKFYQHSYCYIAKANSKDYKIRLTEKEQSLEMQPVILSIDEVIVHMKEAVEGCTDYKMRFILKRDLMIIEHAKRHYL